MIRTLHLSIAMLLASVVMAQKTRGKIIEIPETYPPEFVLPTSFKTIDTLLVNQSGYGFGDFDRSELFSILQRVESDGDLTLSVLLETPEIEKVEITYEASTTGDQRNYNVLVTYVPNYSYQLNYNLHDFQLLSVDKRTEVQQGFRVTRNELREENNKYYLKSEGALRAWINARSLEEALFEAAGRVKWFLPVQETNYAGVYLVSDKKQDYSTVGNANAFLHEGYDAYLAGDRETATEKLLLGADMLSELLKQADYGDKKAFVNTKVAGALAGSIGYAYEYAGKYAEALAVVNLIDEQQLKIPGGLYYNPEFTYNWKERIRKREALPGFTRPEIQQMQVRRTSGEADHEIAINYLEVEPFDRYSLQLLDLFLGSHLPGDRLGGTPEQLLLGENAATLVKTHYGIEHYDGLELYSIDFNQGATSIIEYGIRSRQFTSGTIHKVTRFISADRTQAVDVSVPHGIFNDEKGYRRYVSEINLVPTLSLSDLNLNVIVRKEEPDWSTAWMEQVSKEFPVLDHSRTIRRVNFQLRGITLENVKDEVQTPKSKIKYQWYLVEQMRRQKSKSRLLSDFRKLSVPEEVKARAIKMVEQLGAEHHRRTYNHNNWN